MVVARLCFRKVKKLGKSLFIPGVRFARYASYPADPRGSPGAAYPLIPAAGYSPAVIHG